MTLSSLSIKPIFLRIFSEVHLLLCPHYPSSDFITLTWSIITAFLLVSLLPGPTSNQPLPLKTLSLPCLKTFSKFSAYRQGQMANPAHKSLFNLQDT